MKTACLANKHCVACAGGVPPLDREHTDQLLAQLAEGWSVVAEHHLEKEYRFKNFREALAFANRVGEIAEQEGHHPEIRLSWGWVRLLIWTHKIDGLSESDFILAAKTDDAL